MHGSADIVNEMGERELCGTDSSAYGFSRFHQKDRFEFIAQLNGRRKTVGSCTYNDGIVEFFMGYQWLKILSWYLFKK
jgi:hypothetical protein